MMSVEGPVLRHLEHGRGLAPVCHPASVPPGLGWPRCAVFQVVKYCSINRTHWAHPVCVVIGTLRRRPAGRKNDADRPICRFCCYSSVGYTQTGGIEEFSGVAGVVLPVEKCEESEVSEVRSRERNGSHWVRLRFVLSGFL
jgi:hypothetical protein